MVSVNINKMTSGWRVVTGNIQTKEFKWCYVSKTKLVYKTRILHDEEILDVDSFLLGGNTSEELLFLSGLIFDLNE